MIDLQLLIYSLPILLRGSLITIQIGLISALIGLSLGTILGFGQTKGNRFIRFIIGIYVTLFRGTPMLIQIVFAYFILPQFGIRVHAFWAATYAIGLNSAAYISQIIRSGITSVSIGQIEAAQVLGLSSLQINRFIILPQAFRVVLPALGNEFIILIKDSSLASIIGVMELSKAGGFIIGRTHDALTIFFGMASIYLLITTTLSVALAQLEKRMKSHAQR